MDSLGAHESLKSKLGDTFCRHTLLFFNHIFYVLGRQLKGVGKEEIRQRERMWSSLERQKVRHGLLVIIHILC
jgi:hypothetical protein